MNRTVALWLATLLIAATALLFIPVSRTSAAADESEKKADASFEVYKDKGGEYRWRLRTLNTQVIATSGQSFSSKQTCLDSIKSVKKHATDAPVREVTEAATGPTTRE